MTSESLHAESSERAKHIQTIEHTLRCLHSAHEELTDAISRAREASSELRSLRHILQNTLADLRPLPRPDA